jgi:hypothetical protein
VDSFTPRCCRYALVVCSVSMCICMNAVSAPHALLRLYDLRSHTPQIPNTCHSTRTEIATVVLIGKSKQVAEAKALVRVLIESTPLSLSTQAHQRPRPRQAPEECKRQQQHPRSRSGKAVGNAHVYVDNSNVFLGAQHASGRMDPLVRVNVSALVALVEGRAGCVVKTRLVGGSSPAASSPMWNRYRDAGYSVALADPRRREVFVDDMIAGQISHKILESGSTPQTLVLLSGDGNRNYGRASFVDVVKSALERKWAVHLWAWSNSLSAVYRRMATANSSLHIFLLDGHAETIVFRTRGPRAAAVVNGRARGVAYSPPRSPSPSSDADADADARTAASLERKQQRQQQRDAKRQEEERLQKEEEDFCAVCTAVHRDTVLGPCGHFSLCAGCAEQLQQCPFCRATISTRLKVFA